MTKHTKERPDRFDAHEKAAPDELTFTLLERDPAAPPTILHWVQLRREAALQIKDEDVRKEELRQITNAEMIAFEMQSRLKGEAPVSDSGKELYSGLTVERNALDDAIGEFREAMAEADYWTRLAQERLEAVLQIDGANDHPTFDEQLLRAVKSASSGVHDLTMRSKRKRSDPEQAAFPMEGDDA